MRGSAGCVLLVLFRSREGEVLVANFPKVCSVVRIVQCSALNYTILMLILRKVKKQHLAFFPVNILP